MPDTVLSIMREPIQQSGTKKDADAFLTATDCAVRTGKETPRWHALKVQTRLGFWKRQSSWATLWKPGLTPLLTARRAWVAKETFAHPWGSGTPGSSALRNPHSKSPCVGEERRAGLGQTLPTGSPIVGSEHRVIVFVCVDITVRGRDEASPRVANTAPLPPCSHGVGGPLQNRQ